MNILIVGPGAIGSLWGYSLSTAGHATSVWSRHQQNELSIEIDNSSPITFDNNRLEDVQHADVILVTVKAPQVVEALQPIQTLISTDAIIVLMHNGMGTAEFIAQKFSANPIVLATTTHGCYKDENGKTHHTGFGTTHLGGYNTSGKQCDFLADVFEHALPKTCWSQEIVQDLWFKLAINCAINPLTAIHQINNGQLAQTEHNQWVGSVITEVVSVMSAEGFNTSVDEIKLKVDAVIEATARNHSSMKQDISLKRNSEIDFITGYLLQRAKVHHIETPVNLELYQQIKHIEQSWKS